MISEERINEAIAKVSSNVDEHLIEFAQQAKGISNYLLGDAFKFLEDVEKESLLFIHLIIWECLEQPKDFDVEEFLEIEESNWKLINDTKGTWEKKADVLFTKTKEEDLLSFVEDMLSEEEESQISKELIFITAKSFIDFYY